MIQIQSNLFYYITNILLYNSITYLFSVKLRTTMMISRKITTAHRQQIRNERIKCEPLILNIKILIFKNLIKYIFD